MSVMSFREVFRAGELVESGGPRSVLRIKQVAESFLSVVPVNGKHQMAMRLHYSQLEAVVQGFSRINPRRIAPTIQPVLVEAGLAEERTTENYLYGFAREFITRVAGDGTQLYPNEISEKYVALEGASQKVFVNKYERDSRARAICIAHWTAACSICEMNFLSVYGLGEGFIHVHHLKPLSKIRKEYQLDPITDLIPVCPNCHAMLHTETPPLQPEQLKRMLRK